MIFQIIFYVSDTFRARQSESRKKTTDQIKDFPGFWVARVKPSQYIAQHLYEQKRKSNYISCSSQTSYLSGSKIFTKNCIFCEKERFKLKKFVKRFVLSDFGYFSLVHYSAQKLLLRASIHILFFVLIFPLKVVV